MSEIHVILRDPVRGTWLKFARPRSVLVGQEPSQVLPILQRVDEHVRETRGYAAGFIAYEAAPGFDAALECQPLHRFPLIWFGIFADFEEIAPAWRMPERAIAWRPEITAAEYRRAIDSIKEYIRNGHTYQVNYTYRLRCKTPFCPWTLFSQMNSVQPAPYAAFIDTGEWTLCSASPELFLDLNGTKLQTRPMKGTAPRGLWPEADVRLARELAASPKQQAENLMITDMARNDLGRVAEFGSVTVPSLFSIERFPTVWQMTSTVSARTEAPLQRILQATFPAASITGAPKRRTMQIISALEASPRGAYTGAIGFIAPDRKARFSVAIRTAVVDKTRGTAEYGVGGGITWDSDTSAEFTECSWKAKVVEEAVKPFALLETLLWLPGEGYTLLEYHFRRLQASADYFDFRIGPSDIRTKLETTAAALPSVAHRVRLTLARDGSCACEAAVLEPDYNRFEDLYLADAPVDSSDAFLYHKTTNRQVYESALKSVAGAKDVLLFNERGEVTESTIANVAFEIEGQLYTPPVSCGLLAGTYRAWLLERGELRERIVSVNEAMQSARVFLMNSVRGLLPVRIRPRF